MQRQSDCLWASSSETRSNSVRTCARDSVVPFANALAEKDTASAHLPCTCTLEG
jgi:hypothetical protein